MSMTPADVLRAAKAKIAKPEHWAVGAVAKDMLGRRVHPSDPSAYAWDLVGAVIAVGAPTWPTEYALRSLEDAVRAQYASLTGPLSVFNDSPKRKHRDVGFIINYAIALEEKRAEKRAA